jgi:PST family polysaccharide transporter
VTNDIHRVIKNFAYLLLTKGIDFILPLLLWPFLIRVLGIDTFGILSFALAISLYFGAFMQYGFNVTAVRDIARVRDDRGQLSMTCMAYFGAAVSLMLVAALVYSLLFVWDTVADRGILYLACFVLCVSQSIMPLWFFQGIERMEFVALTNAVIKISYVVIILLLVDSPSDVYLVPLIQGICGFVGIILAFTMIIHLKLIDWQWPKVLSVRQKLIKGWPAFVTQFAPTLYTNSTTFILGLSTSPSVLGFYAAALRIIDICNALAFLVTNAFLPFLARQPMAHQWFKWMMLFSGVLMSAALYLVSPWISGLLFDQYQSEITALIQLISPMILFVFIRCTFGHGYLMLMGKEKAYQNVVFYCALLGFGCSWWIIPQYQEIGAASVMVATSMVMAGLTFYVAARQPQAVYK